MINDNQTLSQTSLQASYKYTFEHDLLVFSEATTQRNSEYTLLISSGIFERIYARENQSSLIVKQLLFLFIVKT